MKTRQKFVFASVLAVLAATFLGVEAHAQHGHLNAGALGADQGSKLYFANGDLFAANSGYVKELTFADTGTYAGYYQGSITPTALPGIIDNGGPVPNHAAFGSFLQAEIVSVTAPENGFFGFWEGGATSPTYSLGTGEFDGTIRFDLSDSALGAGQPGGDPFGHLHGRRFTASAEGNYTVGFRLIDTSTNGMTGGPIHAPSDVLYITFRAIPEPSTWALLVMAGGAGGFIVWNRRKRNR